MLTCVQPQFKGSWREKEQKVTRHKAQTLIELGNLKRALFFVLFFKKIRTTYCYVHVNTE